MKSDTDVTDHLWQTFQFSHDVFQQETIPNNTKVILKDIVYVCVCKQNRTFSGFTEIYRNATAYTVTDDTEKVWQEIHVLNLKLFHRCSTNKLLERLFLLVETNIYRTMNKLKENNMLRLKVVMHALSNKQLLYHVIKFSCLSDVVI